jgi:hypothetical protein
LKKIRTRTLNCLSLIKKERDMKKESVVAVAVIGVMLLGLFIAAAGNPLGAFIVGGAVLTAGAI